MDLALRNARIIDGTGAPAYTGDVGVQAGRIAALGHVAPKAATEIDVAGAVVAPGFIDVHTHYDAQVAWDPLLSPSVFHGVTTVLAGNCGFTLAPLSGRQADTDYLMAMLARVEGMPLAALTAAVKPSWRSFGEFLAGLDGKLGINAAFMVGHSALRRHVMGERAVGHEASSEEIAAMAELLRISLAAGGVGFSTTASFTHLDHNGDPVPSRWATDEEFIALAGVVQDFPGTWIEFLPDHQRAHLVTDMAVAAQRPLNWNLLLVSSAATAQMQKQLALSDAAAAKGGRVYALVSAAPIRVIVNFRTGVAIDQLNGWSGFLQLSDEDKLAAMRDPETCARLQAGLDATENPMFTGPTKDFGNWRIEDVGSEKNARWKNSLVRDYAAHVDLAPLAALFRLAVEEALWLSFSTPPIGADEASWALRGEMWRDERCIIGGSDAGAHLDALDSFALSTQLLGVGVRERGLLSLEAGVRLLTSVPADRFGIKNRARLQLGAAADIVVFDPDTIGCAPIETRYDLPAGEARLYADAIGVRHVIVNGTCVAADNSPTGLRGGRVLRSGDDTYTVKW